MKIIKHLLLELKAKKEGSLYAIRDSSKADNLILLLNYIFFEYTRTDLEYILQNLEVIDQEMDDEVILHGNSRSLILDLTNLQTIYICSFSDYQKFETSKQISTTDQNFIDYLTRNPTSHILCQNSQPLQTSKNMAVLRRTLTRYFTIDRQSFLQILRDWHTILDIRPQFVMLYQNNESTIALKTFETRESADRFIANHRK